MLLKVAVYGFRLVTVFRFVAGSVFLHTVLTAVFQLPSRADWDSPGDDSNARKVLLENSRLPGLGGINASPSVSTFNLRTEDQ